MTTFKELSLSADIQKALDALGFEQPTEIQAKAIPLLLTGKKVDMFGQAQTGTGKTFAFGIPLLHQIDPNTRHVQALIVAPTRELVTQIRDSLRQLTKFMPGISIEAIYGGSSMPEQMRALKKGIHIVVGTPGRLIDHLNRRSLTLDNLSTLILDEADTMLDMGFKDEVDEIMSYASDDRQIWLFSATVKQGIHDLMKSHMESPVSVVVSRKEVTSATTKQYFCMVPRQSRMQALCRFIDAAPEFYGFIFCPTKILTAEVAENLTKRGYGVNALHGDMSQVQRNSVIKKFKKKEFAILVATDVAARGIDVSDATHVVNYSLPDDQESYVHRIGRTGRAGKDGIAITFVANSELRRLRSIAQKFKFDLQPIDAPQIETLVALQQEKALVALKAAAQQMSNANQHSKQLHAAVSALPAAELANAVTHMLYERYLQHVATQKDIETPSYDPAVRLDESLQEFFIGIGEEDGVEKDDIFDFLISGGTLKRTDVKKIKLLRKHTFAVVPEAQAQETLTALFGKTIQGQRVRISITNEIPEMNSYGSGRSGGGRSQRSERSGGGRERGGYSRDSRDSRDSSRGGESGESRGGDSSWGGRKRFGGRR